MSIREFDRFAKSYNNYNSIQKEVAKELVNLIDKKELGRVLDIGCGSGEIYRHLHRDFSFREFIALDNSKNMLSLHPKGEKIKVVNIDFNDSSKLLELGYFDTVISSSALQWSQDLNKTLKAISQLGVNFYFAIFTSRTFYSLHNFVGIDSPIHSATDIKRALDKNFRVEYIDLVDYRLSFEDNLSMLRYIKRSGVSGGKRRLEYPQIKDILKNYPFSYLDFEVLFAKALSK